MPDKTITITYSESWGCWLAKRGSLESIGGTIEIVLGQVGKWMREDSPASTGRSQS